MATSRHSRSKNSVGHLFLTSPHGALPRKSLPWVPALFLLGLLVLAAVITALLSYFTSPSGHTYCNTLHCQAFARLLRRSINASVDPCDSFGRFVCTGWHREQLYSVREQFYRNALDSMSRLTKGVEFLKAGQNALQQVATFYRSCDQLYETGRDDTPLVRQALAEAGVTWPAYPANPNVVDTIVALALNLGWASILDIDVKTTGDNDTIVSFIHSQSFFYVNSTKLSTVERKEYFDRLRDAFRDVRTGPQVSYGDIEGLEQVMLDNLTRVAFLQRRSELGPNVMHRSPAEWHSSIARFHRTGRRIAFQTRIPAFVETFADLWKAHGERDAHLLVSWYAVRFAAHFARGDLVNPSVAKQGDEAYSRRSICLVALYMALGDVVFASYNTYAFPENVRRDVRTVVLGVREAFTNTMKVEGGFAAGTGSIDGWSSIERVFSVLDYARKNPWIGQQPLPGMPDFGDAFVDNWRAAVRVFQLAERTPKRFLRPGTLLNSRIFEIIPEFLDFALVPMALAYPMYDRAATVAVKYGGLGSYVSLASALVMLGRFRGGGHIADARRLSVAAFRACIEADARTWPQVPRHDVSAELAALVVLLDAFSTADETDKRRLTGLSEFSSVQLFFVTWCFMRCTGPLSEPDEVDPCSAELRHVQAFSDAFGCAQGTHLNPENKCRLL